MNAHRSSVARARRLKNLILAGAAVLALVVAGLALAAGEPGSGGGGGGGGGTTTCNPVSSLVAKADPRTADLGFASLQVSYSVKPCVNGQIVSVTTHVAEYADPTQVVWDDPAAPLNGKFQINGIKLRVTYKITVDVTDVATGASAGSLSVYAAAIPKGV